MSPTTIPRADEAGEAVRSPELRKLVELARSQPQPPVSIEFEGVREEWRRRRGVRRRGVLTALAVAAAVLLAWNLFPTSEPERGVAVASTAQSRVPPTTFEPEAKTPAQTPAELQTPPSDASAEPMLAKGIALTPRSDDAEFNVTGTHRIELLSGVLHVAVAGSVARPAEVLVGERRVFVAPGADKEVSVVPPQPPRPEAPTAAELARRADAHMAAGERNDAIEVLSTLVRKHRRSTSAKAGLLDLARLLEKSGRRDRARCAYSLYLERWPSTRLRAEISRALDRLGDGPKCRGLNPR